MEAHEKNISRRFYECIVQHCGTTHVPRAKVRYRRAYLLCNKTLPKVSVSRTGESHLAPGRPSRQSPASAWRISHVDPLPYTRTLFAVYETCNVAASMESSEDFPPKSLPPLRLAHLAQNGTSPGTMAISPLTGLQGGECKLLPSEAHSNLEHSGANRTTEASFATVAAAWTLLSGFVWHLSLDNH